MRASVLRTDPTAAPVQPGSWPLPQVPQGWVLVRVVRAALNRLDEMTVAERLVLPKDAVIGSDAAGVVALVHDDETGLAVGDEVVVLPSLWWGPDDRVQSADMEILGYPVQGTHAEFVAVPVENVYPKPAHLSWDHAAALPLAGVTAWRALVTRGRLVQGETLLVTAASSGVGSIAIQIAAALGARVVVVTSDAGKLRRALSLGAAGGALRTEPDLTDRLADLCPDGVDLVLDPAGAGWPDLLRVLKPGGRLVSLGKKASDTGDVPLQALYWKQLTLLGSSMGSPRDFSALLEHLESAAWRPVVDSVFALDDAAAAYSRLDSNDRFGKVLLAPGR